MTEFPNRAKNEHEWFFLYQDKWLNWNEWPMKHADWRTIPTGLYCNVFNKFFKYYINR